MKYTCIICGYRTLDARCEWEICPVCYWEDDILFDDQIDKSSAANRGLSVSQAQANFILYKACSPEFREHVREPFKEETRNEKWSPLPRAVSIAHDSGG